MATFNPRIFTRPDGLKRIANVHLIALLEPWRAYFAERGLEIPTDPAAEFPHSELAERLMAYDAGMPHELMNGLYYIDETSSTSALDDLLDRAAEEGIAIENDVKATVADIAVQIWLANPRLLEERVVQSLAFQKESFVYFLGRRARKQPIPGAIDAPKPLEVTEAQKTEMAARMDPWFESRRRGRATRIFAFPRDDKVFFLVRHGMPQVREGKHEDDGEASVAFYRPQKHDVLIYDAAIDVLCVNAGSKGEMTLYRETLGDVLFGDPAYFDEGDIFTLDPLRADGPEALACGDVPGITRVRLLDLVRIMPANPVRIDISKSSDLFASYGDAWQKLVGIGRMTSARLGFLFEGCSKERAVTLRADSARYDRESDSGLVEEWLRARGFYAAAEEDLVDEDDPVLESV